MPGTVGAVEGNVAATLVVPGQDTIAESSILSAILPLCDSICGGAVCRTVKAATYRLCILPLYNAPVRGILQDSQVAIPFSSPHIPAAVSIPIEATRLRRLIDASCRKTANKNCSITSATRQSHKSQISMTLAENTQTTLLGT